MKIYVKTGCGWCTQALAWLDQRGYRYEKIDVLADRDALNHLRSISGQMLTPTLEMDDGSVLADFDTRQLEKFLTDHSITPG